MLRSSSLLLLAAVVELIGAGPLPNGSPFALYVDAMFIWLRQAY